MKNATWRKRIKFETGMNFVTIMQETELFEGSIFILRKKGLILQYLLVRSDVLISPYA